MTHEELVVYLQGRLEGAEPEALRQELGDAVSAEEFDAALKEARPKDAARQEESSGPGFQLFFFLAVTVAVAALMTAVHHRRNGRANHALQTVKGAGPFIGHWGYVVYVPSGYTVEALDDRAKGNQTAYFFKTGTELDDPSRWLRYGRLGVIRLTVRPSPFPGTAAGFSKLKSFVAAADARNKEHPSVEVLRLGQPTLQGVEYDYEFPNARVTAYILGEKLLYVFSAGEKTAEFDRIVGSLHDAGTTD